MPTLYPFQLPDLHMYLRVKSFDQHINTLYGYFSNFHKDVLMFFHGLDFC